MSALANHGPERKTWEGTRQPAVPADAAIRGRTPRGEAHHTVRCYGFVELR
jgi:hypothetical protein